jgi:hypothetical protein
MKTFLVMTVLRCEMNRRLTRTRDIACLYMRARTRLEAVRKVLTKPVHSYRNAKHELVRWPLVDIMACEPLSSPRDGDEIIGFICDTRELSGKKSQRTPSKAEIMRRCYAFWDKMPMSRY